MDQVYFWNNFLLTLPEPLRVVVGRELNLPDDAQIWDVSLAHTLVAHGPEGNSEKIALLDQLGIERLPLDECEPQQLMEALASRGCNRVLWECGPELAASALRQGCVQHIAAVFAPKLLGGIAARTPLGDLGFQSMENVIALSTIQKINICNEIMVIAKINA